LYRILRVFMATKDTACYVQRHCIVPPKKLRDSILVSLLALGNQDRIRSVFSVHSMPPNA
jgi:hypothetical protein